MFSPLLILVATMAACSFVDVVKGTSTGSMKILREWDEAESISFVYPYKVYGREKLTPFFDDYIFALPPGTHLRLVMKDVSNLDLLREIEEINTKIKVEFVHIPQVADVWMKDWAPIPIGNDENLALVKMIYNPAYYSKKDKKYAMKDDAAGRKLAAYLETTVKDLPLILDGGNLSHNGKTLIVTTRVLSDNKDKTKEEIEKLLKDTFGVDHVILIEPEPGDETAHTDGLLRFFDTQRLAVSKYDWYLEEENEFLDKLVSNLRRNFTQRHEKLDVIRIQSSEPSDEMNEGLGSAVGNYMNFVHFGKYKLVPMYNIPEDDAALKIFREYFGRANVIPVYSDHIHKLAKLGGVINCVSWVLPK